MRQVDDDRTRGIVAADSQQAMLNQGFENVLHVRQWGGLGGQCLHRLLAAGIGASHTELNAAQEETAGDRPLLVSVQCGKCGIGPPARRNLQAVVEGQG